MKPAERDNLLIRLDERTCNIWREVEALAKHNAEQNGFIVTCLTRSSVNSRVIKIISSIGGSALVILFTKLGGLW